MKPYYYLSLKNLPNEQLKRIIPILEKVAETTDLGGYYLVGAQARDLWVLAEELNPVPRLTTDIDFNVDLTSNVQFAALKAVLQKHHQFRDAPDSVFKMKRDDGVEIDLLPYGRLEDEAGVIQFAGKALRN